MTRIGVFVGALVLCCASAAAQQPAHDLISPDKIDWGDVPPGLPAGAMQAVLYGDPSKPGPFILRARFPSGYRIAPHSHPTREMLTVLSGAMRLGFGPSGDASKAALMTSGAFVAMEPGAIHYLQATEETTIQVAGEGPFQIIYVNPTDDPRNGAADPTERGRR